MMLTRRIGLAVILGLVGPLEAATVTFDVRPVGTLTNNELVVKPGTAVEYQLVVTVTSDTSVADNAGLSLFQLNITTGSGITQQALDAFSAEVLENFTFGQSLGFASGDRIEAVSAAQVGLGNPLYEGVGVGKYSVLATGRFLTPATETSFIAKVEEGASASVAGAGSQADQSIPAGTVKSGPGFTIRTSNTTPDPGGGSTSSNASTAIAVLVGALLALMGAWWIGGPLGLMIGLILVPLLGLLFLMML